MNISEDRLKDLINEETAEEGLTLVDMKVAEHKGSSRLRVFADKLGGITVGECAKLSRRLELVIENNEVFNGKYLLEVSSPGLDRPLKSMLEFGLKIGENIKLFYEDENGKNAELIGKIDRAADNVVTITNDSGEHNIALNRISRGKILL